MRSLKKRLLKTSLVLLIGSIAFSGCAKKIILHPVTEKDIRQEAGWICMTPDYIDEVMKVRLGK